MRAGDQLLAVNGESLVGVPQERLVFYILGAGQFFLATRFDASRARNRAAPENTSRHCFRGNDGSMA